jgi:2',3'-cyclic-nucleotide 3'-phosphodiesterase
LGLSWDARNDVVDTRFASSLSRQPWVLSEAAHLPRAHRRPAISLWLVPPPPTRAALKRIMHARPEQAQAQSPSSYPCFEPHITLGSAQTLADARKGVPAQRAPVRVRFRDVVAGPVYFRSVFVAVVRDEPMLALEAAVRAGLGNAHPPPSFPHQSFAYIDDADAAERPRLVDEYTQKGIFRMQDGRESWVLDCGEGDLVDGYVADAIWIVECDGPVEGWKVLEEIPLDG